MADKDSGRYRYEPYPPITTKQQNNGSNQLTKNEPPNTLRTSCSNGTIDQTKEKSKRCCSCMGPKATSFWVGLLTNLGICTLLFGYTLLGEHPLKFKLIRQPLCDNVFHSMPQVHLFFLLLRVVHQLCNNVHLLPQTGNCCDRHHKADQIMYHCRKQL